MLAVAALGGLIAASAGAWLLLRQPWVLAFATLACIPIRIPFDIGDEDANLLFPLYAVIGALALALGWQLLRGDERSRELGPLAWPLAAVVAWTGIALLWTDDLREGAIFLAAFVLPFGLLAIGFARLPFSRRGLLGLYGALIATALAYAGVGLYQWATREVFWNPKLQVDNAYAPFFRVNSVFWDPSIYGRYLVVAILATLALVLLGVRHVLELRLEVGRDELEARQLARRERGAQAQGIDTRRADQAKRARRAAAFRERRRLDQAEPGVEERGRVRGHVRRSRDPGPPPLEPVLVAAPAARLTHR